MKWPNRNVRISTGGEHGFYFFFCALIFIYGYRQTGRPIKATLCLLVGLSYTMAFTTLVIGHLNILTITFAPILIGLAIDFGVHLITRFEEEMRHGKTKEDAIEKAIAYTGLGILTGALTTAGAFLAMGVTNFKEGIQEMGIICGGGMLLCFVPMMTMLPALLLYGRQNVIDHRAADKPDRRAKIEETWLKRPGLVMTATALPLRLGRAPRWWGFISTIISWYGYRAPGCPPWFLRKSSSPARPTRALFAAVSRHQPFAGGSSGGGDSKTPDGSKYRFDDEKSDRRSTT